MSDHAQGPELLSVSEFLRITRLSESDLLRMLARGEIAYAKGPAGELQIDMSKVTPTALAQRSAEGLSTTDADHLALLEEMVAAEVVSSLEGFIDEAVSLSLEWYNKKRQDDVSE